MPNIAVVTDSNSGVRQEQAQALRLHVIPMPVTMDGEAFSDGVDITHEQFYQRLSEGSEISTSQPSPGAVLDLWNKLLEDYDEIVHIPMSSGLSASYESALMLSGAFEGRVQVVNNQRISVTQKHAAIDAVQLADAGRNALQIREYLEETKFDSSIYIMLDTLKYLKKGGRITPAAAAIGTIMNIKPVLQIHGAKLDAYAKVRGVKQGRKAMIEAMRHDFETRFAAFSDPGQMSLYMAYSDDPEPVRAFREDVQAAFPGFDITIDALPLSVACHIGHGAQAIACCRRLA